MLKIYFKLKKGGSAVSKMQIFRVHLDSHKKLASFKRKPGEPSGVQTPGMATADGIGRNSQFFDSHLALATEHSHTLALEMYIGRPLSSRPLDLIYFCFFIVRRSRVIRIF